MTSVALQVFLRSFGTSTIMVPMSPCYLDAAVVRGRAGNRLQVPLHSAQCVPSVPHDQYLLDVNNVSPTTPTTMTQHVVQRQLHPSRQLSSVRCVEGYPPCFRGRHECLYRVSQISQSSQSYRVTELPSYPVTKVNDSNQTKSGMRLKTLRTSFCVKTLNYLNDEIETKSGMRLKTLRTSFCLEIIMIKPSAEGFQGSHLGPLQNRGSHLDSLQLQLPQRFCA